MNRTKLSPIKLAKGRVRIVTVRYSLNANSPRVKEFIPLTLGNSMTFIQPDVPVDEKTLLQGLNDIPHVCVLPLLEGLEHNHFSLVGVSVYKDTTGTKKIDSRTAGPFDESDRSHEKYFVGLRYESGATLSPCILPNTTRAILMNALGCSWKSCHIVHQRMEQDVVSDTQLSIRLAEPNNWDTEPSSQIKLIRGRICQHETEAGASRDAPPASTVPVSRFEQDDVRPFAPNSTVATLLQRLAFMGGSEAQCGHGSSPCGG